jgi:hypothetical protein
VSTRCHTAGQCDAAVKLALERGVSFEQALEAIDLDNMQGGPSGFYQPNRPLRYLKRGHAIRRAKPQTREPLAKRRAMAAARMALTGECDFETALLRIAAGQ